jgi:riboflavin kinase / FMN adenylyltransferase
MKVFKNINKAKEFCKKGSAIAIGNYDGFHFGHQAIIKELIKKAKKEKLRAVLLTFEPHPAEILAPQAALKLISTFDQKVELLKPSGLDAAIFHPFDKKFALTTPQQFFTHHLKTHLKAKHIYVGHDFTFGDKRSGNIETLERFGKEHGVCVNIIKAKLRDNMLVSSSLIRKLIKEGNLTIAQKLLTRDYYIDGTVIHGHSRGTALGVHTANLNTDNMLLPQDGVYATRTRVGKKTYNSVTNIGFNPTFENKDRSIETHILNFDRDIYEKNMRLYFVAKIRNEIRFATTEALVKQIGKDVEMAEKLLGLGVKGSMVRSYARRRKTLSEVEGLDARRR